MPEANLEGAHLSLLLKSLEKRTRCNRPVVGVNEVKHQMPAQFIRPVPKNAFIRRARVANGAIRIKNRNDVERLLNERPEVLFATTEGLARSPTFRHIDECGQEVCLAVEFQTL